MHIRRHSDYNSYLTKLKYSRYFNSLNNINNILLSSYDDTTSINASENIYNSYKSTGTKIGVTSYNTFIVKPIDNPIASSLHTVYILQSSKDIPDGFVKKIINTTYISQDNTVSVYCVNDNNVGSFNNIGFIFNTYIFACEGDALELVWSSYNNYWSVQRYGGLFKNT